MITLNLKVLIPKALMVGMVFCSFACTSEKKEPAVADKAEKKAAVEPKKEKPKNPWADLKPTTIGQHKGGALHVGFSADGKYLVSTGKDKLIKVWSSDYQPYKTLKGHKGDVLMADFSSDAKMLVSASADETARIWNLAKGKVRKVLKDRPPKKMTEEEEQAYAMRPPPRMNWAMFVADDKQVLTASDDFALKLWDVAKGKKQGEYMDEGCRQRSIHRRRDAAGWVTSSGCMDDGIAHLKFWDAEGNITNSLGDANHDSHYLAFDRGKQFIIGADGNSSFSVYSAQGTFLKRKFVGVYHFCVVFGPDDKTLLVGTQNGEIYVFEPGTWKKIGKISVGERVGIDSLALSPADQSLVAALRNGKVVRFSTPIMP
jgi:WD40 repeat protein